MDQFHEYNPIVQGFILPLFFDESSILNAVMFFPKLILENMKRNRELGQLYFNIVFLKNTSFILEHEQPKHKKDIILNDKSYNL